MVTIESSGDALVRSRCGAARYTASRSGHRVSLRKVAKQLCVTDNGNTVLELGCSGVDCHPRLHLAGMAVSRVAVPVRL